jgi:tRNA pseudouridine38-40 synthase
VPVYRIDIAYDGGGFRGYAANRGVRTVQGEIESVLGRVLRHPVTTSVAGRTDAGVHARANVISFSTPGPIDVGRVERAITGLLGPEVVAFGGRAAREGFDARFSATRRSYRYRVGTGPVADPLRRHVVWHVPHLLAIDPMNRAAGCFLGEHDFASLCRAAAGRSTVRRVLESRWEPEEGGLLYRVAATAFCHQMVRSMVALCVEAGRGRVDPAEVPGILESRDRNAGRGAAPPHGLVLWEVGY